MNTLILTSRDNSHFYRAETKGNVYINDIYNEKCINKFLKHVPFFAYYTLASWKHSISEMDTVLVFDSLLTRQSLYAITKICKNKRLILFFRNKVSEKKVAWNFDKLRKKNVEIWSYNLCDCEKYGFFYHPDPPDDEQIEKFITDKVALKYDIVFLGENKGRENELLRVSDMCELYRLNSYLYVIYGKKIKDNRCKDDAWMKYIDYLNLLVESKAVLDIVNENNWGLTYRPFEALFLKKKLVTNYRDIVKYDFYDSHNVFVIGLDDPKRIKAFLNSPYSDIDESIVATYRTSNWLKGFNIQ